MWSGAGVRGTAATAATAGRGGDALVPPGRIGRCIGLIDLRLAAPVGCLCWFIKSWTGVADADADADADAGAGAGADIGALGLTG
ncbi:MAG: hypothetical protein ACRC0J_11370 [Shewanella oncorhynchi]